MILSCPSCSTRYLLSSASIGAEGRDVRCAKCAHEWFQAPDLDAVEEANLSELGDNSISSEQIDQRLQDIKSALEQEDDEEYSDDASQQESAGVSFDDIDNHRDNEDIPNSVKPEHSNVPAFADDVRRRKPTLQARIMGYATAATIFVCLLVVGLVMKKEIVTAWPPAAAIYDLAGFPVMLKGEELVMESLSATILAAEEGKETLVIKGRVINLTNKAIDVPQMLAVLRSTNGENGDSWLIDAPVDVIEPGASFAFTSDYPSVPRGVGSVNLTFVPTMVGAALSNLNN